MRLNSDLDTKESVKRALWHQQATDPRAKKTTKASKNVKESSTKSCLFKRDKRGGPTKDKADMGQKDAAKRTRHRYI